MAVDVVDAVNMIVQDVMPAVTAVATAVLMLLVSIKAWRFVRDALGTDAGSGDDGTEWFIENGETVGYREHEGEFYRVTLDDDGGERMSRVE